MLIIYEFIYIVFVLFYAPFFLLRKKHHEGFMMRLGFFPKEVLKKLKSKDTIWIHTVSVGETQAAAALISAIKKQFAHLTLVISTVTVTGNTIARNIVGAEDIVIYFPLDISGVIKKVFRLIRPKVCIVCETEIWPNFTNEAFNAGIPLVLVNGRISRSSFRGYSVIKPFFQKILNKFSFFCMQTTEDASRIVALGASRDKVATVGNMKFDIKVLDQRLSRDALGLKENEKLFIAGSTHKGEEEIVLRMYNKVKEAHPELRLLIAPRHIERTHEVMKLIEKEGLEAERFSNLKHSSKIIVLDTIGQLKKVYSLADIVFIGGSLVSHGGQNPIEPAVYSKPILFGPHMFNFSTIADQFLSSGAARVVHNEEELEKVTLELISDRDLAFSLGDKAKALIDQNRGATDKNLEYIAKFLN